MQNSAGLFEVVQYFDCFLLFYAWETMLNSGAEDNDFCQSPHPLGMLQSPTMALLRWQRRDSAAVDRPCSHAGEHYDGAASLHLTSMSLSLLQYFSLCVYMSEAQTMDSLGWVVVQLSWK
jgi:hypothetical protein